MPSHRKGMISGMAPTLDPKSGIEDSEDEVDVVASIRKTPRGTRSGIVYTVDKTSDTAVICTSFSERSRESGYAQRHQMRISKRSERHPDMKLTYNQYKRLIRTNPIVQSYCKSWQIEPAWLPRLCNPSEDGERTLGLLPLSGMSKGLEYAISGVNRPVAQGPFGLSEPTSVKPFNVAPSLPYMTVRSPKFGLILCTPFYSAILQNQPEIPEALFSLRNLTIDRVLKNSTFRHELLFDTNLKVELPTQLSDAMSDQAFWRELEFEIKEILAHPIARAPTPTLPLVLNELKKLMLGVLPCSLSAHICFQLDPARLLDEGGGEDSHVLLDFLAFIYAVIDACVLPLRRSVVKSMKSYFDQAIETPGSLVHGFKLAIWLLNQTKVDFINSQVKERVVLLNESAFCVERDYYKHLVADGSVDPSETANWLGSQPTIAELCTLWNISDEISCSMTVNDSITKLGRLATGFIGSLLRHDYCQPDLPGIFELDKLRIRSIQQQIYLYIQARVESDAVAGCPGRYRKVLPRLLHGKQLESSPLFLLVEKRVFGALVLDTFQLLLKTFQPDGRATRASQLSTSLNTVVFELHTIIALHWRAASFLYGE